MQIRVFNNKEKRDELIKLLKEGYSYSSIAVHFKVDHSTVIWHARKLGIKLLTPEQKAKRNSHKLDLILIPSNLHPPKKTSLLDRMREGVPQKVLKKDYSKEL